MEAYEFEGKTDEDAIQTACLKLNLTREEMDIEVIEPGSAGIFGLVGGRKAKIRVVVKPEEPEAAEETPDEIMADDIWPHSRTEASVFPGSVSITQEEDGLVVAKEALENILALIPMEMVNVIA